MIDAGLYTSYVLFFIAIGATIILPLVHALKAPGTLVKSGISVVGLIILFLISYTLSGSEVTTKYATLGVGENSSKLVGAGLIMFYITFVLALIALIGSEINKAFK